MNRPNRYLSGAFAALLIAAAQAFCADLFIDGFTDPLASRDNWVNRAPDNMRAVVSGGSCTLDNSESQYIGEYSHDFGANKPSVFTLSYVLKSVQGSKITGALFCRQPGDSPSGYLLSADGDFVVVYKITSANNTINADPSVFYERSFDLKPSDNKLAVSKSGSTFNVFANDAFVGSFTDATYASGDISLTLFNNTKTVFGPVHVTDAFTQGQKRTAFSDDFNGNNLKYWRQDITTGGPAPSVNEADGKLKMETGAETGAYIYVDIDLTDFQANVEVSHLAGKLTSPYGFFLVGDGASEMVKFFITGGRYYAVWKSGGASSPLTLNSKIHGSGQDIGMVLTDTLQIKKKKDSPEYEFIVNGEPLTIDLGPVNFAVKGIGLFSESEMTVAFDNFDVKQNGSVSVLRDDKKRISRNPSSVITGSHTFYDLRGRKRYTAATSTQGRALTRAAGVYVNKNGRDAVVRKGRVVSE